MAVNLELGRVLLTRERARLFQQVTLAAFGDLGRTFSNPGEEQVLFDAGLGLRAAHRIGQTSFTTRADFPLFVNHPALAQDTEPGADRVGFRWSFSFSPAW